MGRTQKKKSDTNEDSNNKKEILNIRDIIENSFIKDYPRYIEHLERNGWTREILKIHECLSGLVIINSMSTGNEGTVIDIMCPPGMIISIIGKNSLPVGYRESDHSFELKLANSDGKEISQDTNIRIFKDTIFKKRIDVCSLQYRDVSMLNYSDTPNMFKRYNELYRFDQGVELKGEDHLRIYVINPNINISMVKFNLGIDLWTQCEESIMG